MARYLLRRSLSLLPTLFGVSVLVFFMVHLMPGRPAEINAILMMAPPDQHEEIIANTDLGDPVTVKYVRWAGNLLQGNLGYSSAYKEPVWDLIKDRLGYTLLLTVISLLLSLAISIPLGVWGALRQDAAPDYATSILSFIGFSTPAFFLSLLLIQLFSVKLGWLPVSGAVTVGGSGLPRWLDLAKHLVLPVTVMTVGSVSANLLKQTRASMIGELAQEYCKAARAKGIGQRAVVWRHAFRNSLKPIITLICLQIPNLFSGALVVEAVFAWPGIGNLNYEATINRDYQLIMGVVMVVAVVALLSNFVADVLYLLVDPRIRLQHTHGGKESRSAA